MTDWTLTKGLQNLRTQINTRFPARDKTSDGTIGDSAHQASVSGHNPDDTVGSRPAWDGDPDTLPEVRAWDMDSDLNEPGITTQMVVDHLRKLPNLASVIRYMIYDHTMYHSQDGFAPTAYTGASGHEEHIHFEGARSQAADDNVTYDYRLKEINMSTLDSADHAAIRQDAFLGAGYDIGQAFIRATSGNPADASGTDRAIRNGWDAGMSFAIEIEYKAIMAAIQSVLTELTNQSAARNVITAINSARDSAVAEVVTAFQQEAVKLDQAVASVPDAVVARLQDPNVSDAQVAALLTEWLGARKSGVLAYLNG